MGNFKIKVDTPEESREAQELFQKLLGKENGFITMDKSIRWVALYQGHVVQYEFLPSVEFNEITLPELRDMVKPSLNDQYAEIEQVRQAIKLDDGNDSNHTADAMSYGFMGIKQDNVNNPQHYNKGGVECIDAIEASMTPEAFKGYLKGNVQKYMWRYEQKGGVESLRKAQWYLERLVASMDS